jgi:hypothetical protein
MSEKLSRFHVRLPPEQVERLDALTRRFPLTHKRVTRADLVRVLVARGLDGLDELRPIAEQIPPDEFAAHLPPPAPRPPHAETNEPLVDQILQMIEAQPTRVFRPCRLATQLQANKDVVRNTLLTLAARDEIEKLGPGQYRARPTSRRGASRG